MARYNLTARRKVALRKAQLVSARKRKGKGIKRGAIIGATGIAAATVLGSGAYYRHVRSGSTIHGPYARDITPMIGIAGVQVPGTRAGLRVARFKKSEGLSVTYTDRNKKGDRLMFGYRHRPLPKGAIAADIGVLKRKVTSKLFGSKLPAHSGVTTKWEPNAANPAQLSDDIIDSYPQRESGRSRDQKRRWVSGALTEAGRGRRGSLRILSETQRQAEKKRLPEWEVIARVRDYEGQLKAKGIIPNYPHLVMVGERIRKQGY